MARPATTGAAPVRGQGRDPLTVAALALAVVAFLGSFSHVQEVVNAHGQHGWISFAIACMPEVSVVLFVLKVRRARRTGEATVWAWIVGTSAAAFTVSANLATAEHSPWGYVVAAWPAWASIGAAGLIEMGGDPAGGQHNLQDQGHDHAGHDQVDTPAADRRNSSHPAGPGGTTPAADTAPPAAPVPPTTSAAVPASLPAPAAKAAGKPAATRPAARSTGRPATSRSTGRAPAAVTAADVLAAGVTVEQLAAGRQVAADLVARGESLTRTGLFDGIRRQHVSIGTGPGGQLLALLKTEAATSAVAADDVDQDASEALDQGSDAPAAGEQTSGSAGMAGVVDLASHHHPTDRHDPDLDDQPDHDHQPDHDNQEDQLQYLAHANGTHHPDHLGGHDGLVATIGGTR